MRRRWFCGLALAAFAWTPAVAFGDAPDSGVSLTDLAGILVVDATIDGKGPFHFVLDTGAGITVVTPALAETLAAKASGATSMSGMGKNAVNAQTIVLDTVSVGTARQTGVLAAIVALPPALTYQGRFGTIDGVLGYSFLSHYAVTIDVVGDRASFVAEPSFEPPASALALPISMNGQSIPLVAASADGVPGRFEIDSGNNGDVTIAGSFAKAHAIGAGSRASETRYQGVGGAIDTKRIRLRTLAVGGFVLHRMVAALSQIGSGVLGTGAIDGNLGYDFIHRFVLTLDYPGRRLYLRKSPAFDAFKPVVGNGIAYDRNADGAFSVAGVTAGSPAERAGITARDTIVAIGGNPVRAMSDADFQAAVDTLPGTGVTYTLDRNGVTRTVTVTTVNELP